MKRRIYFNEYNVRMNGISYLPLVSGLLRAYSETYSEIRDNYEFMPFIYEMDTPDKILSQYTKEPDIACFSSVMWNERLNYHIAKEVKKKWPRCLIIFGGANVPMPPQHSIVNWMMDHPYVDLAVRGEGEEPFIEILKQLIDPYNGNSDSPFFNIPGVAYRTYSSWGETEIGFCDRSNEFNRDMEYPSPYLEGLYDDLLKTDHQFQAIIETNRGCPFPCTFCYWGRGGLSRKFRYKDMEKVFAEIDWMGRHQIKYVFNADSNFGMNDRDQLIAEHIVETKKKYNGFPEKFRTCFGKNTDEKIFKIGALFHSNQLEKGITLARQSNDLDVLKNIRRNNIKMSTYVNLQKKFNDLDIPVYGELILGLPGETKESWRKGVDELLEAGTKNQLFIYLCQVFNNTEMAEDAYKEKFGIVTKRIKLAEIHGEERPSNFVQEYEDIIIQTNSMSHQDWVESLRFSYVLMLFHSLKISYYVMIYLLDKWGIKMSEFIQFVSERKFDKGIAPMMDVELDFYDQLIDGMIKNGNDRGTILPSYGKQYWDVEEASFLRITQNTHEFYTQLERIILVFLKDRNIQFGPGDWDQLSQVIDYQQMRIPHQPGEGYHSFRRIFWWNIPEYFEHRFSSVMQPLAPIQTDMVIQPESFANLEEFARKSIMWGRKSGTMLVKCKSSPVPAK